MERRTASQKVNLGQITSEGSSRPMAGSLRRRNTRRKRGNMGTIRGNPQATLGRCGRQRNSPQQDHGHYAKRKNNDRIWERIQDDSGRDRIGRRNLDPTPIGRNVKETTRRLGSRRNRQSQHNPGHHDMGNCKREQTQHDGPYQKRKTNGEVRHNTTKHQWDVQTHAG